MMRLTIYTIMACEGDQPCKEARLHAHLEILDALRAGNPEESDDELLHSEQRTLASMKDLGRDSLP
jgi:DNA-binding GntR family transcriptional regulator